MRTWIAVLATAALVLGACGEGTATDAGADRPTVVVTTSILGDVVANLLGDQADVVTIMPVGASPHEFQASPRQVAAMREADLLITNGRGFEAGLLDVVEAARADGVPVHEAASILHAADETASTEHAEDEHAAEAEHGHDHEDGDPHFFTDPVLMARAAGGITDRLAEELAGFDRGPADEYLAGLAELHEEVQAIVAPIPPDRRVLVTNHDVMGAFAGRYGFEVVGTVIPSGSTSDGTSAGELAKLVETVKAQEVPAVFVDASSSSDLAETLAKEVGDVAVVELFTESLGGPGSGAATYLELIRTNAERIAEALA